MTMIGLDLWFSKCGPQTSIISITWELCYKYKFLGPNLDLVNQKPWGRAHNLCVDKPSRWTPSLRTSGLN